MTQHILNQMLMEERIFVTVDNKTYMAMWTLSLSSNLSKASWRNDIIEFSIVP